VFDELGDEKLDGGQSDLAALDSVFAFAGREWDNDVGLYYNRARWLDPRIGRFISEDPLGFEGGDTNLYRYAANNPFLFTDSTGLSWLSDLFDGIGDFFEDTFKQVGNFVNNIDKIIPALAKDPLFWTGLVVGPLFAANLTWGAFEAGFGLGGFYAGPNWFELGREALSFATGGGLGIGMPSFSISTPIFNFSQSLNVAAFLPGGMSGAYAPNQFVGPNGATPLSAATTGPSGQSGVVLAQYAEPVDGDLTYDAYVDSWFNEYGGNGAPVNQSLTDFNSSPWTLYEGITQDDYWNLYRYTESTLMPPNVGFDPFALRQGGFSAFSQMAYGSGQGAAFESLGRMAEDIVNIGRVTGEIGGSVLFEPLDWALTARDIYNEPYNLWNYAGFIPGVPSAVGRYGDEAAGLVGDLSRTAAKKVGRFTGDPDDLTKTLGVQPRITQTQHGTRRYLWQPNSNTRIRFESHPGDAGNFTPRHHGEHYHVENKPSNLSWNQAKKQGLIQKVKPDGYVPGYGTGFLPGEAYPGQ
jgi:RHS repeat-associated protein